MLFIKNDTFLGDAIIGSIILANTNIFKNYDSIIFVINDLFQDLFYDYKGKIQILYFNTKKYRYNFIYKINLINKIREIAPRYCFNLNYRAGYFLDELPILSGAEHIFANEVDRNTSRLFGSILDSFYDRLIPMNHNDHELIRHMKLLNLVISDSIQLKTYIPSEMDQSKLNPEVGSLSKTYEKIVMISPFSSNSIKDWPMEYYKEIVYKLIHEFDYHIALIGTRKQFDQSEDLVIDKNRVTNLCGITSYHDVIFLMSHAKLFLGNDSGLAHLAHALKITYIIISGGGSYNLFFPYPKQHENQILLYNKMDCFGCGWHCIHQTTECVNQVSVDNVYSYLKNKLS